MQVQKNSKKKFKLLRLTGPAAASRQSVKIQALNNENSDSYPSLNASKNEIQKENQTSLTHRASCQLQLQARVSKFKLSLTETSNSCPSLDISEKQNAILWEHEFSFFLL
jgi:hypothetical protein